jgi:hypothetical protein
MIRTQISLSKQDYRRAKKEAKRLGISLAELFRRSLKSILPEETDRSWMRYRGLIASGDPHSSRKIDDVVYGRKD